MLARMKCHYPNSKIRAGLGILLENTGDQYSLIELLFMYL